MTAERIGDRHGAPTRPGSAEGANPAPAEPLDRAAILSALRPVVAARIARLEILERVDSTNARLCAAANAPAGAVCVAESQERGRGRRGRAWISPPGNLYLSLLWRFAAAPGALVGLAAAMSVALTRALESCGYRGIGLKWPNDLLHDGRKIAGILIEAAGGARGPSRAVVGVGVNVRMPRDGDAANAIDRPWSTLEEIDGEPPSRNRLAAAALNRLLPALMRFEAHGLTPFLRAWRRLDLSAGRQVRLERRAGDNMEGVARGIDDRGALLLEQDGRISPCCDGELSLRFVSPSPAAHAQRRASAEARGAERIAQGERR